MTVTATNNATGGSRTTTSSETGDFSFPDLPLGVYTVETALAHGTVDDILTALGRHPAGATVAIVGHEPTMSMTLARLLGAADGERFPFRKGGAALVDLPDGLAAGGRLVWFLRPKVLRALAGD